MPKALAPRIPQYLNTITQAPSLNLNLIIVSLGFAWSSANGYWRQGPSCALALRQSISKVLQGRWMVLPVPADTKTADLRVRVPIELLILAGLPVGQCLFLSLAGMVQSASGPSASRWRAVSFSTKEHAFASHQESRAHLSQKLREPAFPICLLLVLPAILSAYPEEM